MNSNGILLEGYNLWFTIEIISFYSYIFSATLFIIERTVLSSLSLCNKKQVQDLYMHDFLNYHAKEATWFAFVHLLWIVTGCLCYFNYYRLKSDDSDSYVQTENGGPDGPLRPIMWILLVVHTL